MLFILCEYQLAMKWYSQLYGAYDRAPACERWEVLDVAARAKGPLMS